MILTCSGVLLLFYRLPLLTSTPAVSSRGKLALLRRIMKPQMMMAVVMVMVMVGVMTWTLGCCVRHQAAQVSRRRVSRSSASLPTQTVTSVAPMSRMAADGELGAGWVGVAGTMVI